MAIHTVKFNKEVTFTNTNGVDFFRNYTPAVRGQQVSKDVDFDLGCQVFFDDGWVCYGVTVGQETTIVGGICTIYANAGFGNYIEQSYAGMIGTTETVEIVITVDTLEAGSSLDIYFGNDVNVVNIASTGVHRVTGVVDGVSCGVYNVGATASSKVEISRIEMRQITPATFDEQASLVTSATVSPADVIEYEVTWVTDPVEGDIVEFRYNSVTGNYIDNTGDDPVDMDSQDLTLKNCLDVPYVPAALPWLFFGSDGAQQSLQSAEWLMELGTQYNDILYLIARQVANGQRHCFKYENRVLTQLSITPLATNKITQMLFIDRNGKLNVSFYDPASTNGLLQSIDGITWTLNTDIVLTAPNNENGSYIQTMDESESGNQICAVYSDGAGVTGKGIWLSVDGGSTWIDKTAEIDYGVGVQREHIHNVAWDRYRQAWFVSTGDKGADSILNYSLDDGATFQSWAGSFQMIGMAFTKQAMFFTAEVNANDDASIYKATEIGGVFTKVRDIAISTNGWCRVAWEDTAGYICFIYGSGGLDSTMHVSNDNGVTWTEYVPPDPPAVALNNWGKRFPKCSDYATKRGSDQFNIQDGFRYKVYSTDNIIDINVGTGADYQLNANGVWDEIPDFGGLKAGCKLRLTADYNLPYFTPNPDITIDLNGFAFTYTPTGAMLLASDFDGNTVGTLIPNADTANGASVNQSSTERAFSPPQSCKLVNNGGGWSSVYGNTFTGIVEGEDAYMEGMYFYDSTTNPSANTSILSLRNGFNLSIRAGNTANELISVLKVEKLSRNLGEIIAPTNIQKQSWNKIKVHIRYSTTSGFIRLWINDKPVIVANGIDTSGAWDRAVYSQSGSSTDNAFWDDIEAAKDDVDYL